jgi:hypothetical protein
LWERGEAKSGFAESGGWFFVGNTELSEGLIFGVWPDKFTLSLPASDDSAAPKLEFQAYWKNPKPVDTDKNRTALIASSSRFSPLV